MNIVITLILNALALIVTAYIVPGFHVSSFTVALLAAIVLAIINTFIKPALVFLTAPLNVLTLGLFAFVVNAIVLWLATLVVPGLMIDSFLSAVLAAIVLALVSTALAMLLSDIEGKGKSKKRRK